MTIYLSDKIRILSFISIILVLYIHSGFHEYPHEIAGMPFNIIMQELISEKLGRCAVPLFYAISGYLFFHNIENSLKDVWNKMKKRVRTLLIPYLIACLFLPIFLVIIECVPGIDRFVNFGNFSENLELPIWQLFVFIYIDSGSGSPCAFHLWFLRDLIIIVTLSPILYWVLNSKVSSWFVCLLLYGLSLLKLPLIPFYGLFWYMFGSYYLNSLRIKKYRTIVTILFIAFCVVEIALPDWKVYFRLIKIPIVLLGLISIWTWYDSIVPSSYNLCKHPLLNTACHFTFFVYLYHEPTINIVRKLLVIPLGQTSFGFAFSYLASPWLFTLCFISIGVLLEKYANVPYKILVGGR